VGHPAGCTGDTPLGDEQKFFGVREFVNYSIRARTACYVGITSGG
jgi:hypothetical protein